MFVDELTIQARAGNGGDGVVRWLRERHRPLGGPAGGDGGDGGDVYVRGVKDLSLLSKYTGEKVFFAQNGESGGNRSRYGHAGVDTIIEIPVGATVTDVKRNRVYNINEIGETFKILKGGKGGYGNVRFKSSTNRSPKEHTKGEKGEEGSFHIELSLIVDAGLIGLPNAGKSTLLNTLTNAKSAVGSYPFTTVEPHLGDYYGYIIADIPGLIAGASEGKGLGHKFLRHVAKTKMLLHLVSLEEADPVSMYNQIRTELEAFDKNLLKKEEWVVLTKSDLKDRTAIEGAIDAFKEIKKAPYVLSAEKGEGIDVLKRALNDRFSAKKRVSTSKKV